MFYEENNNLFISICPYCLSAKRLLENLNLNFEEKSIDHDTKLKEEMLKNPTEGRLFRKFSLVKFI